MIYSDEIAFAKIHVSGNLPCVNYLIKIRELFLAPKT